jgi:hypothetical protein
MLGGNDLCFLFRFSNPRVATVSASSTFPLFSVYVVGLSSLWTYIMESGYVTEDLSLRRQKTASVNTIIALSELLVPTLANCYSSRKHPF